MALERISGRAYDEEKLREHMRLSARAEGGVAGLKSPLAADSTKNVSRDYGVLIEAGGIALRGLFVIDPERSSTRSKSAGTWVMLLALLPQFKVGPGFERVPPSSFQATWPPVPAG